MANNKEQLPEWIPYLNTEHKSCLTQVFKVSNGLHKLQKNQTFCDITIKVEDTSFPAHKAVLAACSEFFTTMFMSDFQESHAAEVTVTGTPDAFQVLLDFAYSGQLELTMKTVIDVLEMAHYIQFDDVVDSCKFFLKREMRALRVDIKVIVRILSIADTLSLTQLVKSCKQNLANSFRKLEPSEDFLEYVTAELMEAFLESSDLTDEKGIFDMAVAWLRHHWEDRKQYAASFFQKIRLGVVPTSHLSKVVFKHPDLYSIPECKEMIDKVMEMVDKVMKTVDSRKQTDQPLSNIDPSLFATRTTVNTTVFIGSHGRNSIYYDTCITASSYRWQRMRKLPDLPFKDCLDTHDSCCNAQGHLYVAQGTVRLPRKLKCPQFLKLDVANKKWCTLSPMIQRREDRPLVYMNGKIFAIGGGENPASCEAYSIEDNRWESIKPIAYSDINMDSISCASHGSKNRLLVYAGTVATEEGNEVRHMLQMYNNNTGLDRWSILTSYTHPFSSTTGLVVHDGKCYRVVGGSCNCKEEGCDWHQIVVHELVINIRNDSATLGEKQDQLLIPAEFKKKAFRINQDVFVVVRKNTYHKTGIKITSDQVEPVNLDVWDSLLPGPHTGGKFQFTTFMVDKALWV
ncbi:kelch-like protein 38 [Amphiura filiformis]|uniref:kelch-like protein 38 n=1 Tax=Amphiura filiformis TaxID=82378 RepID=UPI003B218291